MIFGSEDRRLLVWWLSFYSVMQLIATVQGPILAVAAGLVAAQVITKLFYPEKDEKIPAWILRTLAVVALGVAIQWAISGIGQIR